MDGGRGPGGRAAHTQAIPPRATGVRISYRPSVLPGPPLSIPSARMREAGLRSSEPGVCEPGVCEGLLWLSRSCRAEAGLAGL